MKPILISWSGGKDAAFALHRLRQQGTFEPVALFTSVTDELERIAMHGIRREILLAQGRALGLPVIEARQPRFPDNARYEAGFAAALSQARTQWPDLSHIAFGDLFLADVRAWREDLLARHGWQGVFPLWGENTEVLAMQMMQAGIDACLCCIDTHRLDADYIGRRFDASLLRDLPDAVDPCGEHGEFHTLVSNAPGFDAPLRVEPGVQHRDEHGFLYLDFTLA